MLIWYYVLTKILLDQKASYISRFYRSACEECVWSVNQWAAVGHCSLHSWFACGKWVCLQFPHCSFFLFYSGPPLTFYHIVSNVRNSSQTENDSHYLWIPYWIWECYLAVKTNLPFQIGGLWSAGLELGIGYRWLFLYSFLMAAYGNSVSRVCYAVLCSVVTSEAVDQFANLQLSLCCVKRRRNAVDQIWIIALFFNTLCCSSKRPIMLFSLISDHNNFRRPNLNISKVADCKEILQ